MQYLPNARMALACGLILALGAGSVRGQAVGEGAVDDRPSDTRYDPSVATVSCGEAGCCDACGPGGPSILGGLVPSSMRVFGGAEYRSVRPTFSDAPAFIQNVPNVPAGATNVTTRTYEQLNFDYESTYRWFVGVRDACCGYDFTVSGANVGGDASAGLTIEDGTPAFSTPFDIFDGTTFNSGGTGAAPLPGFPFTAPNGLIGTVYSISSSVDLDYWDITFSKTIALGSPLCGASCDCGAPCGCDCGPVCPAWDITWMGGIRIADGGWNRTASLTTPAPNPDLTAVDTLDFSGAGLLGGIGGRRYIGRSGMASFFFNTEVGLLLGDVNINRTTVLLTAAPTTTTVDNASFTRVVPVIDIEAGGTLQLSKSATLSAGYLLQSWHDLGMGIERSFTDANAISFDDANILGFDGFFIRGEYTF